MRLLTVVLLLGLCQPALAQSADRNLARAKALHRAIPMIDTHNDLPEMLRERADNDLAKMNPEDRLENIDTDLPRLKQGLVGGQFWAAYVPASFADRGGAGYALEQIDVIRRMTAQSPSLGWATTATDIARVHAGGQIASLIGIEGGYAIENSLANLRMFYELGVRYLTLTHGGNTAWADAATEAPRHGGLTKFGEEVVREMNRVGMMVDISHVSDGTMSDAIRVSEAPVIFSHSSARALANHARNVPDSILALMPKNRGIVMVNIFPGFVNAIAAEQAAGILDRERDFNARYPDDPKRASSEYLAWLTKTMNEMEPGTLAEVADHVDHIIKVAGIDHVGYGADFGSLTNHPKGLEDVSRYPYLTAELLRRGYTDEQVKKIIGGNFLRVMREVEHVSARIKRQRPASTALIGDLDR
ncbi:MAG: membrane dipeptidase [Gemmatimonadetes bacterium]|nr:membrane dipeptidase [Gemmatimonadota bacterium]